MYNSANDSEPSSTENGHSEDQSNGQKTDKPAPVQPVNKPTAASIFGGAKPVDTAAKEREIEARLRKEREAELGNTSNTGNAVCCFFF